MRAVLPNPKDDRHEAIELAVLAALMHVKPDYRSPKRLNDAARIIAEFVDDALDDFALPARSALDPFRDRLSVLCAKELAAANGDADRIAEMIERLAHALAFSVAIAGQGSPAAVDNLLTGAVAYLYECATDHQQVAQLMARPSPSPPSE